MGANATSRVSEAGEWTSPLIEAAFFGHTDVVRLLLDNGADVNEVYVCCFSASTALMEAARYNHLDTAKLLLARGADVHFVGYENWTALRDAEQTGNEEMVDLLDAAGAMSWRHRAERRLVKLMRKDLKAHHYYNPD